MIKNLVFIVFIFFGIAGNAQILKKDNLVDTSVFPQEIVQLSINSSTLLAGELLQYKAYSLNSANKKSELSKLLYVSLRSANDSVIFSHKLKIENGAANGDFFIPSNLKTGIYKLIGYTNFSKNNAQNAFAQKVIYVINTFVKSEMANATKDTIFINASVEKDFNISEKEVDSKTLKVNLNKQTFGLREKVTLNLESTDISANGNYSISVRKVNPLKISNEVSKAGKSISPEVFYVPELRGQLISGVVTSNSDNVPAANKEVALTIPGKDYIFKTANTNAQGRFFFSINEAYDAEKSIVQLFGDETARNSHKIVLDDKDLKITEGAQYYLKLEPQLKEWLEERSVQMQVENAYYDTKKDSILKNKINPSFYNNFGTVYFLDDYTRFPTVRETFIEVVTLAAIRGSEMNTRFLVNNAYDPNKIAKFNSIDPLVLMDGMLIQDNSELINYNARDIDNIRVIIQPYRYGSKIYSGIIAVETKKGDFNTSLYNEYSEEINLPALVKQKEYYSPDYSGNAQLSRIPDYRVQLLWQPEINLSEKGFLTSFYTSDASGTFEILVEGFSNRGVYLSEKQYIKVLEN